MTYGTPTVAHENTVYTAAYRNAVGGEGVDVTVRMVYANEGGGLSEATKDALFQQILDLLDGASFLEPKGDGYRNRVDTTLITPTP